MQLKLTSKWVLISTRTVVFQQREPKIKYHLARSKGQAQTHLECHANFPGSEREHDLGKRSVVWHFPQQRWCGPPTVRLGGLQSTI